MPVRSNQAAEDYLKVIYQIIKEGRSASTNEIAQQMGVKPASATGMIQKLAAARPALVSYERYRGARLTAEGERAARKLIRLHELLEAFLQHKLGYPLDEVHAEADRLEHVISEDLEAHIAQALQGSPISPVAKQDRRRHG